MTLTWDELCTIVAQAKSIDKDFWRREPLYIAFGTNRNSEDTTLIAVLDGPDLVIDVDKEGNGIGIEFVNM